MSDPQQPQPTQEELEAYFAQLRQAPVQELLMQSFSVLGTGAEVKLGLPDARVLIDAMEGMLNASGSVLGEIAAQLEEAVKQLKVAQVQAEKQIAEEGGAEAAESGDESGQPATPPQAAAPPPQAPPAANPTDKLWIPGRDG